MALVPGVNVIAWVVFLVVRWPIEIQLGHYQTPGLDSPEDEKIQAGWELQRLSKRAVTLAKLADRRPESTEIEQLEESGFSIDQFAAKTRLAVQQFADKTSRDAEQAASLLAQVVEADDRIRKG